MNTTMKHHIRNNFVIALALLAAACAVDDGDEVRRSELGAAAREYIVPAGRGTVKIDMLASGDWQAEIPDAYDDWLEIASADGCGDGTITVDYRTNDGFARMAALRIFSADRSDTVYVKQRGTLEPVLTLPAPNITVKGAGGEARTQLTTNIDTEDIDVDIMYTSDDEGGWIRSYDYSNGYLFFDCAANATEKTRNARVRLSFTDGWGETLSATLYQTQANRNEELGRTISSDELHSMAGVAIAEDVMIKGYIVSDQTGGNAGDVQQTSETTLGYDEARRTAYIESLDGRYGFRILCASQSDNIFEMYSQVSLLLKGATVVRDSDPSVRSFTIEGITSNMVATAEAGTRDRLPEKRMRMSQLSDDDIYTYVTLADCEIPVRKGSLTPVNEGYGILFGSQRLGKYPLLIRDIQSRSMYLMTNMTCTYRRNGKRLPYGSGSLRGVVVHETFEHFSDSGDPAAYGDIGRYQLRHQSEEDIYDGMGVDFKDSFSELAFEMRYAHIEGNRALATEEGMEGYVTLTSLRPNAAFATGESFAFLGPVGRDHSATSYASDVCGIELLVADGGSSYTTTLAGASNAGKGLVQGFARSSSGGTPATIAPSLWTQYVWNYEDTTDGEGGSADGFLVCFQTTGISTSVLSLQLATFNNSQHTPRWWKVEWSEGGTKSDPWIPVGTFRTAVFENYSGACMWNLPAAKVTDLPLPTEMLGRERVYLRIVPAVNATGDNFKYYDPDTPIAVNADGAMTAGRCGIDYLGIRYNK